jgi:hypothetical protein
MTTDLTPGPQLSPVIQTFGLLTQLDTACGYLLLARKSKGKSEERRERKERKKGRRRNSHYKNWNETLS